MSLRLPPANRRVKTHDSRQFQPNVREFQPNDRHSDRTTVIPTVVEESLPENQQKKKKPG
jgi:hypothetical protein